MYKLTEQKINKEPKISLNKLGEYLTAKPGRRNTILKNSKFPKSGMAGRNNDFYNALQKGVSGGEIDTESIYDSIYDIENQFITSPWQQQNKDINSALLKKLIKIIPTELENLSVTNVLEKAHLNILGVDISIRPDLLIEGSYRGTKYRGGVKFHLPKTNSLNSESGEYIATLLKQSLEGYQSVTPLKNEFCIVVDLYSENIYRAPKAFKKRMLDIKAACNEIHYMWPNITE